MKTVDCLEWEGSIGKNGYGRLSVGGKRVGAHRATYEAQYGPIPQGWDVHHECKNKTCVNPHHLLAMPKGTHTSHHMTGNKHAVREICVNGHSRIPGNRKACPECDRIAQRAYMRRKREERQ